MAAFPDQRAGRLPHCLFRGLIGGFTFVPACLLAESPNAILSIEGFDGFVTSTAAPIASGWSDELPGGAFTRWKTNTCHGAPLIDRLTMISHHTSPRAGLAPVERMIDGLNMR